MRVAANCVPKNFNLELAVSCAQRHKWRHHKMALIDLGHTALVVLGSALSAVAAQGIVPHISRAAYLSGHPKLLKLLPILHVVPIALASHLDSWKAALGLNPSSFADKIVQPAR